MGWASGSGLICDIAEAMKKLGTAKQRIPVYEAIVSAFNEMDWDTQDEATGVDPALDVVLLSERLEWLDEDDEDCTEYADTKKDLAKAKKKCGVK